MQIPVNLWAVVLAALSSVFISCVWYRSKVFNAQRRKWGRAVPVALVAGLLTAYVLAHLVTLANNVSGQPFVLTALITAFWAWAGLVAARGIAHDSFENRPRKLMLLNTLRELLVLLLMGLIIGLMPPSGLVSNPFDYPMDCSDVNSLCHGGF